MSWSHFAGQRTVLAVEHVRSSCAHRVVLKLLTLVAHGTRLGCVGLDPEHFCRRGTHERSWQKHRKFVERRVIDTLLVSPYCTPPHRRFNCPPRAPDGLQPGSKGMADRPLMHHSAVEVVAVTCFAVTATSPEVDVLVLTFTAKIRTGANKLA